MQTIAAPEGLEIDGKYAIGTCLAEGERQAVYETSYHDRPAIIKVFHPESSRAASELLGGFAAAKNLQHPNLIAVYDFGQATLCERRILWLVCERGDDSLNHVLRGRLLDEGEVRELLTGVLPALEYLHEKKFIHSRIRPSNVLACGETVKLSADRLRSLHGGDGAVAPPGLHDAPETGTGVFEPAADAWSLAVLTLEALTGSPLESSVGQLNPPFSQIVEGGLVRNPAHRWTLRQMATALRGEPTPAFGIDREDDEPVRPRYRKLGGIAIGGALATGAVCAFLIRGAHQAPPPLPAAPVVAAAHAQAPALRPQPLAADSPRSGWAVVGAAYRRQAHAEKRAAEIRKSHPSLGAVVYQPDLKARRFLVVFGSGLTAVQARRQLERSRREGAPRGTYITQLR